MDLISKRWLLGRTGLGLAFLWGMAEATFFFIVPDVLISLIAAFSFRRGFQSVLAALAGALIGGIGMFQFAVLSPDAAQKAVHGVPFVTERMFDTSRAQLELSPLRAMVEGPARGIPYKIYAVQAPAYMSLAVFAFNTVPARVLRFLLVWMIAGGLGVWTRKRVNDLRVVQIHGIAWICFYAAYWCLITTA
jgi:hypothetical protein